jgi:hypothetical protein
MTMIPRVALLFAFRNNPCTEPRRARTGHPNSETSRRTARVCPRAVHHLRALLEREGPALLVHRDGQHRDQNRPEPEQADVYLDVLGLVDLVDVHFLRAAQPAAFGIADRLPCARSGRYEAVAEVPAEDRIMHALLSFRSCDGRRSRVSVIVSRAFGPTPERYACFFGIEPSAGRSRHYRVSGEGDTPTFTLRYRRRPLLGSIAPMNCGM